MIAIAKLRFQMRYDALPGRPNPTCTSSSWNCYRRSVVKRHLVSGV